MDTIRTRLEGITIANGFSRNIGAQRVHEIQSMPTEVPPPGIILVQGDEMVDNRVGDRYACTLELMVGFVDKIKTKEPNEEANIFLAEIQKVMAIEISFSCPVYPLGSVQPGTAQAKEIGNSMNISTAVPGMYLGQIVYDVMYRRNVHDPNMF
jgi:hypothetical protein